MNIDQAFDQFIEFPEGSDGKYVTTVSAKLLAQHCVAQLELERDQLISEQRGAADMLREAAKQFRVMDCDGHARMCERHANGLTQQSEETAK